MRPRWATAAHFFFEQMGHFEQERHLQSQAEEAVARELPGVEVLDLEFDAARELLRIFIDSPSGVDHELCANVTSAVRESFPQYALEVSSPGIERPVRRREHFLAVKGSRVRIRRRGSKRPFRAQVVAVDEQSVSLRREDDSQVSVPFDDIARSHLIDETPIPATKERS